MLSSGSALNTDVQYLILTFSQNLNIQEPWKRQNRSYQPCLVEFVNELQGLLPGNTK